MRVKRFKEGRIGDPTIEEFKIRKPFGFSSFHKELIRLPESWIKTTGDLLFWREHHKVSSIRVFVPGIFAHER